MRRVYDALIAAAPDELKRIAKQSADNQTEYFGMMALAQMGSRPGAAGDKRGLQGAVQKELLGALAKGKGQKKPWAAMSLGVFGNALLENDGTLETTVISAVRDAARKGDRPAEAGAYDADAGLGRHMLVVPHRVVQHGLGSLRGGSGGYS